VFLFIPSLLFITASIYLLAQEIVFRRVGVKHPPCMPGTMVRLVRQTAAAEQSGVLPPPVRKADIAKRPASPRNPSSPRSASDDRTRPDKPQAPATPVMRAGR
jgi:hypothetical protein